MSWQPIGTAPKDGTGILLALDYHGKFLRYVGQWSNSLNRWMRDETDTNSFPTHMQGWFTHWAPIPDGPLTSTNCEK